MAPNERLLLKPHPFKSNEFIQGMSFQAGLFSPLV